MLWLQGGPVDEPVEVVFHRYHARIKKARDGAFAEIADSCRAFLTAFEASDYAAPGFRR